MLHRHVVVPQLPGQPDHRCRRLPQWLQPEHLRGDVHMESDERQLPSRAGLAGDRPRRADGHAELVGAQPGRNVRMAVGRNVRIDPERHPRDGLPCTSHGGDPVQLAGRFRVDRLDPQGNRPVDLGRGLPHAGEDDIAGSVAGP